MHLETSEMYGNSTDMYYFYANVYIGGFNNTSKQSLIVDTGSGLTCFPCEGYWKHCGKHLNKYFPLDSSGTKEILDCNKNSCGWVDGNKWSFSIRYGEGSSYSGFWVIDDVYFGNNYDEFDKQRLQFGCVTKETNLFYSQEADGNDF